MFQFSLRSLFVIVTVVALIVSAYFGVGQLVGMSRMEVLTQGFGRLIMALPTLLVWIVGLTVAIRFRKRNRLPGTLTIIALCGFVLTSLVGHVSQMALIHLMGSDRVSHVEMGWIRALIGVLWVVFNTVCWILILVAIFSKRVPDSQETDGSEPNGNPFLTN